MCFLCLFLWFCTVVLYFLRAIISYMVFMFGVCLHIIMYFCFNWFSTANHNGLMCAIVFVDFAFSPPEPNIILLDVYFGKLLFIMINYSGSNEKKNVEIRKVHV